MFNLKQQQFIRLLAHIYLQCNQISKAVILLNALLSVNKTDIEALKMLAYAYQQQANYKQTTLLCDQFINLVDASGPRATIYLIKALSLWHQGDSEAANKSYALYLEQQNI